MISVRADSTVPVSEVPVDANAIVFVANDKVFALTLAFLESLRQNSPNTILICIPYDENCEKILVLQSHYGFHFWPIKFDRNLEELSLKLYGKISKRLVKLHVFSLPIKEFFMLDVDIVVLKNLDCVFGRIDKQTPILYMDEGVGGSYTSRSHPLLINSREINSGAFVGSNRFLTLHQIISIIERNFDLYKEVAFLANDDQPMLNFAIDFLGIQAKDFDECSIPISGRTWFLNPNISEDESPYADKMTGKPIGLIHYAGYSFLGLRNAPRFSDLYMSFLKDGCTHVGIDVEQIV